MSVVWAIITGLCLSLSCPSAHALRTVSDDPVGDDGGGGPPPPPPSVPSSAGGPQFASDCPFWNPLCWVKEGLDSLWDDVTSVVKLTRDVITLKPRDVFQDFKEIAYNQVCNQFPMVSLVVSSGLKADFDDCTSPPHPIEPVVLRELQLYSPSAFDSVQIHENCNLNLDVIPGDEAPGRNRVTFGEHIYFAAGDYHPLVNGVVDPDGFAQLTHELTHVLQYRDKGLADFTCEYALSCRLGKNYSCDIERKALEYEALVLDDQEQDGDGVFLPVDNCPRQFNPGQRDTNGNGLGNACDPGNECRSGETRHDPCGGYNSVGSGYDYDCDNGWWERAGGWCAYNPSNRPGDGGTRPLEP